MTPSSLRIDPTTSVRLDAAKARMNRIVADLSHYIRAERLDECEIEIVALVAELKELRLHVRQLRAQARRAA